MYVFQLFDYYACNGACVLFLSVFETLTMGWIFGESQTGNKPYHDNANKIHCQWWKDSEAKSSTHHRG